MCKHVGCNSDDTETIECKTGPHTLKIVCQSCHKFIQWGSRKLPEEKRMTNEYHRREYYAKKGWNYTPE